MPEALNVSTRFVALGDSFIKGAGDDDASRPNGVRVCADHIVQALGTADSKFAYANLAVCRWLLPHVLDEQPERALAMNPDLVSLSADGNDLMRPERAVEALEVLLLRCAELTGKR